MILWCAYCQTCLGEKEPYGSHTMSHSICDACVARGAMRDDAGILAIKPIADLYRNLRTAVFGSNRSSAIALVTSGLDLGLKPEDLAWGVLQPLLYETGELWAKGLLSIAHEHQVSQQVEEALGLLFERSPSLAGHRQSLRPFAVLTLAARNYHSIGVRLLEFHLAAQGVDSQVYVPGLPIEEVLALARDLRPVVLGVSVSMPGQMQSVDALRDALLTLPAGERPRLVLGGCAFRLGLKLPAHSGYSMLDDLRALAATWAHEQGRLRA
jgi:MerR family transcriptional regulator, light-induced transcriptional regulator